MRKRKHLSPKATQALIWGAAIVLCAFFAVVVFVVTGRGRPVLPEPATIPVSPEVASRSPEGLPAPPQGTALPTPEAIPDLPLSPAGPSRPEGPQTLTEALFIEISALMYVAQDSFTDSDVGQRSYERACEGILERQGVSRADFERMSDEIGKDSRREARVVDAVLERADQLRHPTNVRAGTTPGGVVDPGREPPPPPTPPR